jgi:hypothetical protein
VSAETITDRQRLDRLLAEAIRSLLDRGEFDFALAVGRCTVTRVEVGEADFVDPPFRGATVYITAPPDDLAIVENEAEWQFDENGLSEGPGAVLAAFADAAKGITTELWPTIHVSARAEDVGRHQGTARQPGEFLYRGIRYRSRTEMRVAEALDDANVLYFPLPLGIRHYQRLAEPDFLVIHLGLIGVLEIDGPTHTPLTRAQEAAKDAKLIQSGVRLVHHEPVAEVDRDPAALVQRFLTLLRGPIF